MCLQCNAIMGTVIVSFGSDSANPSGSFALPPIDFGSVLLTSANVDGVSPKADNIGISNYLRVGKRTAALLGSRCDRGDIR